MMVNFAEEVSSTKRLIQNLFNNFFNKLHEGKLHNGIIGTQIFYQGNLREIIVDGKYFIELQTFFLSIFVLSFS